MFVQLKRYFYLYKKDILPLIIFLFLFLLVLTVFIKFCLIDTGIINIIDSTKINIPEDVNLNSNKVMEDQKKILANNSNNNKDLPFHKTPIGKASLIAVGIGAIYVIVIAISDALK